MTAYVAILEDAGPSTAAGVWFPDLPGCFSAGEDIDKALRNAGEALAAYAEALAQDGRTLPAPRSLAALRDDPEVAPDLREHIVACGDAGVRRYLPISIKASADCFNDSRGRPRWPPLPS